MFVSQHFRDLANEQGRALLANGALSFCLQNDRDDLEHCSLAFDPPAVR